jgi:collagen type VII alpha
MSTRVTYKLGIDEISPAPSGTGGDLIIDNFKTVADLIEDLQNNPICNQTYVFTITDTDPGGFALLIHPEGTHTLTSIGNGAWTGNFFTLHKVSGNWQLDFDDGDGGTASFTTSNSDSCPTTNTANWSTVASGKFAITSISNGGMSGYSGRSGYSGVGISGFSGRSGYSGVSGYSGTIGTSGFSGVSGYSGRSGYSGVGTSGFSGYSGISGYSGRSGYSGSNGQSGFSGYSGINAPCYSYYEVTVTGNAGAGTFRIGPNGGPVNWYGVGSNGYQIYLDETSSTVWTITQLQPGDGAFATWTATKTNICPSTSDSFSLTSGSGSASISAVGVGQNGTSGFSGYSGRSGYSGVGTSGFSGYSGVGISGFSGYSGNTDPLLLATTTSTVGQVKINGTRVLHSYGTNNFFVGTGSGNFTVTGNQNYFAVNGGAASISSGSYNTALGYQALNACSTGSDNLAIGRLALAGNGGASVNLGIGNASLYQHTTGTNNVAVGGEACRNGTTRNSVVAIGYQAGYDTLGTGTTYIGRAAGYTDGTTATSASLTNATAIGYYAQVQASNSLVLGGTGSYLVKGGIGTVTPNSRWHVNGSFATAYRAISAARTLDDTDHVIECTANTFTVTLPAASGITGRQYIFKNTGAGTITVDGNASETIDGSTTATVAAGDKLTIVSNGTNWISI